MRSVLLLPLCTSMYWLYVFSRRTKCGRPVAISCTLPNSVNLSSNKTKTWALARSAALSASGLVSWRTQVILMHDLHTTPYPLSRFLLCCTSLLLSPLSLPALSLQAVGFYVLAEPKNGAWSDGVHNVCCRVPQVHPEAAPRPKLWWDQSAGRPTGEHYNVSLFQLSQTISWSSKALVSKGSSLRDPCEDWTFPTAVELSRSHSFTLFTLARISVAMHVLG